MMDRLEHQRLVKEGFNRIPLYREVLADLETPLSTYLKLAHQPYSYLLESVEGGERWGRYSIIGLRCETILKVFDREIIVTESDQVLEQLTVEDPLTYVEQFRGRYKVPQLEGLPRFSGGLVGYFGYETIRYIESRLNADMKPDPIGTPDILLMVSDQLVVFDNLKGTLQIIVHAGPEAQDYDDACKKLDAIVNQLKSPCPDIPLAATAEVSEADFKSNMAQADYEAGVERIKEYILAGDVMQVVPSQRMTVPFEQEPIHLYRALRVLNPSPYLFYYDFGDFHVVGSSPEILTRLEDDMVTVRPIAGTRRRGQTPEEDIALEKELLADPKEVAEHLMLIDLGRNDVGRVAQMGSVELTQKMVVERYSHVMHIVSNVDGKVTDGQTAMDILKATFPAGTLSGAPKIRAMEIIDELEPVKRGIYSGAVGYLTWFDDMDVAIAIRTAVIKDGQLHIQAGAGVVADSVPTSEWEETLAKGRAMFRAVALVANGLVCGE